MKRGGFTLVELMISLSILTVLAGSMFYAFGVELRFWQKLTANMTEQQMVNNVMARIVSDIRSAREIVYSATGDDLILLVGQDRIEYSLTNQKLRRRKNNRSSYLTDIGEITAFSVAYPTTRLIEIKVNNDKTRAGLRN